MSHKGKIQHLVICVIYVLRICIDTGCKINLESMYFRCNQTGDFTYLMSKNNGSQFGNCIVTVIAKFVGMLSGCGCCEKSPFFYSFPPWGHWNEGEGGFE